MCGTLTCESMDGLEYPSQLRGPGHKKHGGPITVYDICASRSFIGTSCKHLEFCAKLLKGTGFDNRR